MLKAFDYYCALGKELGFNVWAAEHEIETINDYYEMVSEDKKNIYSMFLILGQKEFGNIIVKPIEQ